MIDFLVGVFWVGVAVIAVTMALHYMEVRSKRNGGTEDNP